MKRPRTCECCGQTLPRALPSVDLSHHQNAILERVQRAGKHGVETNALFDHLYSSDPNGGPSFKSLAVHVQHLNKKLALIGKRVVAGRGKKPAFYRLEDL